MKAYGFKKATEFSKKQIGVIYRLAKNGDIKIEQWIMSNFYDLADYFGYDDNGGIAEDEAKILKILDAAFAGRIDEVQERINDYTEDRFEHISKKYQKTVNRAFVA